MTDRKSHRTAAQTAAALGLTAKALRVWERGGLLRPGRTPAGWRTYGPEEFTRIHKILALRGLGLALTEIADLLKGRSADLGSVLAMQAEVLARRKAEAETALAAIRAAQARIAAGAQLSLDELSQLIRETTMTKPLNIEEIANTFGPLWKKHFTPEELEGVKARSGLEPEARVALVKQWGELFREAQAVMRGGDPESPAALDLARRWQAALQPFEAASEPGVMAKARAMRTEAESDPASAQRLPITADVRAFMRRATDALKRRDGAS